MKQTERSLEEQIREFAGRKFLAIPLPRPLATRFFVSFQRTNEVAWILKTTFTREYDNYYP